MRGVQWRQVDSGTCMERHANRTGGRKWHLLSPSTTPDGDLHSAFLYSSTWGSEWVELACTPHRLTDSLRFRISLSVEIFELCSPHPPVAKVFIALSTLPLAVISWAPADKWITRSASDTNTRFKLSTPVHFSGYTATKAARSCKYPILLIQNFTSNTLRV